MAYHPIHNSKFDLIQWGDISFGGSQEGEYISITPREDLFSSTIDATGENSSITVKNDDRADVILRLQRQSPLNIALTEIVRDMRNIGSFTARDITFAKSDTLHMYELKGCAIMRLPVEVTGDDAPGPVEWNFECTKIVPREIEDFDTFSAEISAKLGDDIELTIDGSITIEI